jgi:GxxExxY protein
MEAAERDPLTEMVIGAAIDVHRQMGPGLLESVYQKCMKSGVDSAEG